MAGYDNNGNVYDPAALAQAMSGLGSMPDRQALLKQHMEWGHDATQAPAPKGMQVGGTYMASSPLEHIAAALQRVMGYRQQGQGERGLTASLGEQDKLRGQYADALMRAMAARDGGREALGPYQGDAPQLIAPPPPNPIDLYRR